MSAETLRQAASLMRERAEAASTEHLTEQTLARGVIRCSCGASSVADWLDWIAQCRTVMDGVAANTRARGREPQGPGKASQVFLDMERHALAVARAYLGSES